MILRGLEGGTSATDKTQSGYEGVIIKRTTPLLLTCSITSHHSESDSAQMETTMSQSCYCLWTEERKTPSLIVSVLYLCLPRGGCVVFKKNVFFARSAGRRRRRECDHRRFAFWAILRWGNHAPPASHWWHLWFFFFYTNLEKNCTNLTFLNVTNVQHWKKSRHHEFFACLLILKFTSCSL